VALILIIDALLLGIGAFLLKRGWWPRRIGDTPHCPKCDYILSGDQQRCPECGTAVETRNVVRGERHRRVAMAGIGGLLAFLGGGILLSSGPALLNNVNWQRYEPLSWLLSSMTNISSPAWAEVQRRLDNNLLSETDQNAVVERGLAVQNTPSTNIGPTNVLDFIGKRYLDNKLTASQADRFFANLLNVNLSVRHVVGAQSQVPYSVFNSGPGRTTIWWYRLRTLETQIDDQPVQSNFSSSSSSGGGSGGLSIDMTLPPIAGLGKHRLRCRVEKTIGTSGGTSGPIDENAHIAQRVAQDLFADFEVIEGQTPIAMVEAPTAAVMRSFLTPRLTSNPAGHLPPVDLLIFSDALPVDAAFDLFVRINAKEYWVGTVIIPKGPSGYASTFIGANNFPADLPANIDIILRSSEAAAGRTVDMKRIWKGEIIMPNVPIGRPRGTGQ
jgi:hypothetical protein